MQELEIVVDFNGIVIFDPALLRDFYPGIDRGENLYRRFTQTEDGDKVVAQGIIVPITGINDSIYKVVVRSKDERSSIDPDLIVFSNSSFPLRIENYAVIADMASLLEWHPDEEWQRLGLQPGEYAIEINGFRKIENRVVVDFGFEVVWSSCGALPEFSGSLSQNMQVLELPER